MGMHEDRGRGAPSPVHTLLSWWEILGGRCRMQSEGECSAVTAGSERLGFRKQDLGTGGGLG